jgi:apolipoprotein N-acyltransferase
VSLTQAAARAGAPVAAILAGALAAVAFPPWGLMFGLFGWSLLFVLVDAQEGRGRVGRAFRLAWLAGTTYFLIGCWWVAEAFQVFPEVAWMAPFAALLLGAGLGLFWGAAAAVYRRVAPAGTRRAVVFAAILAMFEWLRGHVLTGFPWNLPGEAWLAGTPISQLAAWIGAYGLTFVTIAAFAAFGLLVRPGSWKHRAGVAIAAAVVLAGAWIAGSVRLMQAEVRPTRTVVRVVQPDVDQKDKWTKAEFQRIVTRYVNLTARPGDLDPTVVVWPEGALPIAFEDLGETGVEEAVAGALKPGQVLLMGSIRSEVGKGGARRYYNSLHALVRDGEHLKPVAVYDKHRLVPFGEYMPGGALIPSLGIKALGNWSEGFDHGPRPGPIALPGMGQVQPLICYESLFPGLARNGPRRPDWIVNISNDAWFGRTSGPIQHLNLASYRAIEQGLPIVRATPTGVSAVIDPWGRVLRDARLNPGASGAIDSHLPEPAGRTIYAAFGDLPFALLIALGLAFLIRRPGLRENNSTSEENAVDQTREGE